MKLNILKSCAGNDFSFYVGQAAELDESTAKDLIAAGYAEEVKTAKPKAGAKQNVDTK